MEQVVFGFEHADFVVEDVVREHVFVGLDQEVFHGLVFEVIQGEIVCGGECVVALGGFNINGSLDGLFGLLYIPVFLFFFAEEFHLI